MTPDHSPLPTPHSPPLRILYLAHRIPYPPNKGDKIRSYHQVRHLARRHVLDLACLCDVEEDMAFRGALERWCRRVAVERVVPWKAKAGSVIGLAQRAPLSVPYFHRESLQRRVDRWLSREDYDVVLCFSSPMAEYLFRSRSERRERPLWIMDFCDMDSDKWLQYSKRASGPARWIYGREAQRLLDYEKKVQRRFHACFFVSRREAALFMERVPEACNVRVAPNGVDTDYFRPLAGRRFPGDRAARDGGSSKLVFVGAMDYAANVDGVVWFAERIFPRIRREIPGASFWVVGSRPHARVRALGARPGIKVTGFVPDVRPHVASAACVVVPLRLARGVQNKVLEGMAMGRPAVVTPAALDGIEAQPGRHVLVAEDEDGFARRVLGVLRDPDLAEELGGRARRFVKEHHGWEAGMDRLERVLVELHRRRKGDVR
ncbi:sugar transferase, PEP-CTERM/EpsH1 system associated [Desulfacinum hydrothermale DSM 13146]|uniref:Sugar transferase, PEP-CTERM/EpsH1 system associated n=1 Tax=Desulfacinum hydrothermale DSM 13146 TaxID=1121390 RepID=A0A1W1XR12_9BACT|nr:TIGR03087 family PEP-CTERM/XrtA system glycosyltransferase [Desulfacinum hydrothermale]SMC26403.1 sugar transferase, PEP-CTERM/EpsH1 system associated [Desulfacinum hydrothermale DSM 13146]